VKPSTSESPSRPRSSLRAISLLSGSMFAQFALQFVYQLALAKWYGAGIEMDAFQAAQTIPMVLATILVGSLQYAFVPVFIQRREQLGPDAAWELAGTTGLMLIPGVALLSLAGCLAADPIIRLLFPGYSPAQIELTVSLFRVMVWLTWTISVTAFFQTVLQSAQIYGPAAVGPFLGTLVTFVASWLTYSSWGILGIAWSTVGGALVSLVWQAPLYCRNARHRWRIDDGTRHMWLMLLPLLLGAAVYKLDPLLDRYLASELTTGSVSQLSYASRLIAAFLTLTTNGLAMVVFPVLVVHAASGHREHLKSEVGHALQLLVFLLLPLCLALGWYPVSIIRDLFERGRFTPADTLVVADLLLLYLGVLVGGSAGEILSKTFFAMGDSRTPTAVRIVGFVVGAGLKLWWGTQYGLRGLVWATSCYYLLIALLDWVLLNRRVGAIPLAEMWDTAGKCGVAAVMALAVASLVLYGDFRGVTILAGGVGGLVYLTTTALLRESIALRICRGLWPRGVI
jgi:putative peptidoglycan lipid II flippase